MRKLLLLATLLLLAPASSLQAQQSSSDERRAASARRDSLEAEILQKFVERLTRELRLDPAQRTQVEAALRAGSVRRHELLRASSELRGRMYHALRDEDTADAEFAKLLADSEALRAREHALWEQDQAALARVLNPRQRVQFLISWSRFQETLREILSRNSRDRDRRHP